VKLALQELSRTMQAALYALLGDPQRTGDFLGVHFFDLSHPENSPIGRGYLIERRSQLLIQLCLNDARSSGSSGLDMNAAQFGLKYRSSNCRCLRVRRVRDIASLIMIRVSQVKKRDRALNWLRCVSA